MGDLQKYVSPVTEPLAEGTVSECCGAAVEDRPHKAGVNERVCLECGRFAQGAAARAHPRACPQCWHHVEVGEWRQCCGRFCPVSFQEMRPLTVKELGELNQRPRRFCLGPRKPFAA